MPVQINEMIIRANIVEPGEREGNGAQPPAQGGGGAGESNKDEIVKECAELVMEIINSKMQR